MKLDPVSVALIENNADDLSYSGLGGAVESVIDQETNADNSSENLPESNPAISVAELKNRPVRGRRRETEDRTDRVRQLQIKALETQIEASSAVINTCNTIDKYIPMIFQFLTGSDCDRDILKEACL